MSPWALACALLVGLACGLLLGAGYNYRQLQRNALELAKLTETASRLGALSLALADGGNRNAVQCGVQRADGAPCTLEIEHLGAHSYAGVPFEQIFDGYACPHCGRKGLI